MRALLVVAVLLLAGCAGLQQDPSPSTTLPAASPTSGPSTANEPTATSEPSSNHTFALESEAPRVFIGGLELTVFGDPPRAFDAGSCMDNEPAPTHRASYAFTPFVTNASILMELQRVLGYEWTVSPDGRVATHPNKTLYWEHLESGSASLSIRYTANGTDRFEQAWRDAELLRARYLPVAGAWENETREGSNPGVYHRFMDQTGGPYDGRWLMQVYPYTERKPPYDASWNVWLRPHVSIQDAPGPMRNQSQWLDSAQRVLACMGSSTDGLVAHWAREAKGTRAYVRVEHDLSFWGPSLLVDPWEDTVLFVGTAL